MERPTKFEHNRWRRRQAHPGRLRRRQHRRPGHHRRADGGRDLPLLRPRHAGRGPQPRLQAATRATARGTGVDGRRRRRRREPPPWSGSFTSAGGVGISGPPRPGPASAPGTWTPGAGALPRLPARARAAAGCRPGRSRSWPIASPPSWAGSCSSISFRGLRRLRGRLLAWAAGWPTLRAAVGLPARRRRASAACGWPASAPAARWPSARRPHDPRVRGVAAMGAPADFDDWASHPRRLLLHAREVGIIRDRRLPASRSTRGRASCARSGRWPSAPQLAPRPLLVLHGSDDESVPVFDARVLADAHGDADLRIIDGAGHQLRHDPRAVAVLLGWLDRQRNQAASAAAADAPLELASCAARRCSSRAQSDLALLGGLLRLLPLPHLGQRARRESTSATERGCSSENGAGDLLPAGGPHAEALGQDGHEDLRLLLAVAGQLAQPAVELVAGRHVAPDGARRRRRSGRRRSRTARGRAGP